jgi:hypothetical protein
MPLHILHEVFQIAMGWWNYHLHDFRAKGRHFGDLDTADGDPKVEDETKFVLADLVNQVGDKFIYDYDFGDSWSHEVIVEKEVFEIDAPLAVCTAGKRACPPEDVGSNSGYLRFLEIIEDPEHVERNEMLAWAGGNFDPDSFDVRIANLRLILLEQQIQRSKLAIL